MKTGEVWNTRMSILRKLNQGEDLTPSEVEEAEAVLKVSLRRMFIDFVRNCPALKSEVITETQDKELIKRFSNNS